MTWKGGDVSRPFWLRGVCGGLRFNCGPLPLGLIVEPIHSATVGTRNQVAVDVHGDLNRMVSHLLLDVLRRLPILKKQGSERVPIMPLAA